MRATVPEPAWRDPGTVSGRILEAVVVRVRTVLNASLRESLSLVTSGATVTEIWRDTMPDNSTWQIIIHVEARDTSSGDRAFYSRLVRYRRNGSAVPVQVSDTALVADAEDDATWALSWASDANGNVILSVQGDAFFPVIWSLDIEAFRG